MTNGMKGGSRARIKTVAKVKPAQKPPEPNGFPPVTRAAVVNRLARMYARWLEREREREAAL